MNETIAFCATYPCLPFGAIVTFACMLRWQLAAADRKRTEWILVASLLAVPLNALAEHVTKALSALLPLKRDEFVYAIDAHIGEPSFVIGRFVEHWTALKLLCGMAYGILPFALVAVFATYLWTRSEQESLMVLRTLALNLVAAIPIYLLFPVCGPHYAFDSFPYQAPAHLVPKLIAINAPPNGVPSVHTSSALLILWFMRRWRGGLVFGFTFLALTILATMGSGEHYFFDLLCALPYAMIVYRIAHRTSTESGTECSQDRIPLRSVPPFSS